MQSCNQKSHYDKHINRKIVCVKQTDKLQELIDKGECSPYYHLSDGNYIGGLTIPSKFSLVRFLSTFSEFVVNPFSSNVNSVRGSSIFL